MGTAERLVRSMGHRQRFACRHRRIVRIIWKSSIIFTISHPPSKDSLLADVHAIDSAFISSFSRLRRSCVDRLINIPLSFYPTLSLIKFQYLEAGFREYRDKHYYGSMCACLRGGV